ncbi:hypothetical protein [Roseomonas sp. KE2513]|nr:hypothetical protein [Roseomonas sp. KE2513]
MPTRTLTWLDETRGGSVMRPGNGPPGLPAQGGCRHGDASPGKLAAG